MFAFTQIFEKKREKNRNQKIIRLRKQDLRWRANRDGRRKKVVPYSYGCHFLTLELLVRYWNMFKNGAVF